MAYTITSESYGRRLPKITAIADSTDDLATLGTDFAEGSTVVIGDKTYSLDKVQGWIEPGSGGGGGSSGPIYVIETIFDEELSATKTVKPAAQLYEEFMNASDAGIPVVMGAIGTGDPFNININVYGEDDGYSFAFYSFNSPVDAAERMSLYCWSANVDAADANDHPFVFEYENLTAYYITLSNSSQPEG